MSEPAVQPPRAEEMPQLPPNPFPGLRPFETNESELFFGRHDQVRELLGLMRRNRFLAVVGASGCGKSSLIRAGLLAALRDGFLVESGAEWRIAVMRPGDTPIHCLAQALHAPGALGDFYPDAVNLAALEATLRRGSLGLVEAVAEAPLPPKVRLFLLIDQFEELFRFGADPERSQREARAFVKLFLETVTQRQWPVYVGITMRSDFLGNCAALPGLPDAINQGLYLVPQMGRAQLREAVRGPVELYGARITERLVNRLLNDLGEDADQLPILQHAMMRLWSLWSEGPRDAALDLELYEPIGGIAEALSRHVGQVYDDLSAGDQRIAQWLFRKLTQTTRERQVVRQSASLESIAREAGVQPEEVAAVVEQFRAPGRSFLMPPSDVALIPATVIDISHESLIRQWKKLSEWAALEARDSRLSREIRDGAALWDEKGREPSFLWQGRRLAEAEEWRKAHPGGLAEREEAFVLEGIQLRDHQILAQRTTELPQKAAEEAAARESAITNKRAYVYISAATQDSSFVAELRKALKDASLESWTPDSDLAASGPCLEQAMTSIDGADAVLCVLSPEASSSAFCREEIDRALKQNKRLIPILYRECDPSQAHPALGPLEWVDLRGGQISEGTLDRLFALIGTDFEWVRAHTRLLLRAAEWQASGRNASLLLWGKELKKAEEWLAANNAHRLPKVTEDQTAYVMASRKTKYRLLSVVLGFMTLAFLGALLLSFFAFFQWKEAEKASERAKREKKIRVGWASEPKAPVLPGWRGIPMPQIFIPEESLDESYEANRQLEAPEAAVAERRKLIEIRYPPNLLGPDADLGAFDLTLQGLGFTPVRMNAGGAIRPNGIWIGSEVLKEDIQQIAYALIRAGVDLQYIGCFQNPAGLDQVVLIGGRPDAVDAPFLTVETIDDGSVIPSCGGAATAPS
ncbi:MAG TPA: TIR domain-containing protein [Thermoanaerobaculia bacterium]|nr:TIR domain-containing protein [Thermoanaerobaculia bacterium]